MKNKKSDNSGQAIVEAAVALTTLVIIFMTIYALWEREENTFKAFLVAREIGWTGIGPANGVNYHVDGNNLLDRSADEEIFRQGIGQTIAGHELISGIRRVVVAPAPGTSPIIDRFGVITFISELDSQKVFVVSHNWNTNKSAGETQILARDYLGEYHMGQDRYNQVKGQQ